MVLETIRKRLEPLVLTILRVAVGFIMAAHGFQKLTNIPGTIESFTNLGIPSPQINVYLAIAGELGGGLGLLAGLFTPLAAFGVFSVMVVAITQVHLHNGLLAKNGGFEYPLTLLCVALYFIVRGGGPASLDALLCKRCHKADDAGQSEI